MLEHTIQQGAGESSPGATPRANPMAMCPMAKMCARMMDKPLPRLFLRLAGAVAVLLGITLLIMARFMGRLRNR